MAGDDAVLFKRLSTMLLSRSLMNNYLLSASYKYYMLYEI
jgi:hypothetical protein